MRRTRTPPHFDKIREQIMQELRAYTNDPPPVETLIRGI
jgi:hypothetical protein